MKLVSAQCKACHALGTTCKGGATHSAGTATGSDVGERSLGNVGTLEEVVEGNVNGIDEEVQEWEEVEFLVDSGASATVVGKEEVRAVQASEPDSSVHYRLADGSRIPNLGEKYFRAVTEEYRP